MMERLLSVIETLQWFNCGSVTQSGKLLFLIPCRFPDGSWTVAELLIQKEPDETREDSGKAKTGRIVLTAQLEGLGWVRAELALENKDIRMAFLSESTPSKSRIESRLPFLIETLQGRGFRVGEAKCEVGDRDRLRHSFVHDLSGFGGHGFHTFA